MRKYATSFGIAVVLLATSACDGDGGAQRVVNPTPIATVGASRSVSVQPSDVATERVPNSACPTIPPFVGSLSVNVQAVDFPLSLSLVRMTFTDSVGLQAPEVTLPAPAMTRQFGSTLVEARSQRTFSFHFPFGCDTSRNGTLLLLVVFTDPDGREITRQMRLPVH
jgi:hypothetical protein